MRSGLGQIAGTHGLARPDAHKLSLYRSLRVSGEVSVLAFGARPR